MPKFKNRLFGQNVDQTTIEVFKNLQDSSFDRGPNESITQYEDYLGDRTTFARMWTATLITGSADGFSLEKVVYHIVNDNRERSYEPNQPITDSNIVNELTTNALVNHSIVVILSHTYHLLLQSIVCRYFFPQIFENQQYPTLKFFYR